MEKLFKALEKDILKCKETLGEGETGTFSQDWASQIADEPVRVPPTPGNIRKRKATNEEEDTEVDEEDEALAKKVKKKKVKKNTAEDKMDKLLELVQEMREDNKNARAEVIEVKDKLTITDKKVDKLREEFNEIKEEVGRDSELTAEMREDIDGLENENLRIMVIIRKLKAEKPVPKDKKELRTYVQDLARVLAGKVLGLGQEKSVKYAVMLYSFVDPTKKDNRVGLVPPFKICFNTKDAAVAFRDRAVKLAKSSPLNSETNEMMEFDRTLEAEEESSTSTPETNIFAGAYFSFYQTAATRFRVTLMWAVADTLKTKTRQAWVNQGNKPTLQIKEGGKIIKSLTFVQTMADYKEKINKKTLDEVKKSASKLYAGQLEKTFLVIKD